MSVIDAIIAKKLCGGGGSVPPPSQFKPDGISYLTFSSRNRFSLGVAEQIWDGTIEYFAPDKTWTVWDGASSLSAEANGSEYVLYLRGTGNAVISAGYGWNLEGFDISCIGNIETLLDYATVESGGHPVMGDYCYSNMFSGCTSLTRAPELPATTLAEYCYENMFDGCTSLIRAPELPATTLARSCYRYMFYGCTSLTRPPELPATTLAHSCYSYMFSGCTSLTRPPELPVTTLAFYCYENMFDGCTSLIRAPELPATTLASSCYSNMFYGCTSLTRAPELPATTLAEYCYNHMFDGCTSLIRAPELPATTLADSCYISMFYGCTSLTRAPELPATTLAGYCYTSMFDGCTSLIRAPELPATTLADNCYSFMFCGCTSLKLSETKTEEYTQEYRIPFSGAGTDANAALSSMFISTGGTFTGTPAINTTYYLSSDNMIVRGNDIANLNGYVKSMIDNAECIIPSSTSGSTKKFKITVDDSGTISATEVT